MRNGVRNGVRSVSVKCEFVCLRTLEPYKSRSNRLVSHEIYLLN